MLGARGVFLSARIYEPLSIQNEPCLYCFVRPSLLAIQSHPSDDTKILQTKLMNTTPLWQGRISSAEWINTWFPESCLGDLQRLIFFSFCINNKVPLWLITPVGWGASVDKAEMSIAAWFIREDPAIRWDVCLFGNAFPHYLQNTLEECERRNHQIPGGELKWSWT